MAEADIETEAAKDAVVTVALVGRLPFGRGIS